MGEAERISCYTSVVLQLIGIVANNPDSIAGP